MSYITGCLVCCFLLLLWISVSEASESYCVSEEKTSWANANKTQRLVTPDINYNKQNPYINIDIDLDNRQVWIGYFKALTAFEYFGCVSKGTLSSSKTYTFKSNGPGICFSACGRPMYVGLRSEMCYCIENRTFVNYNLTNCDKACTGTDNDFLCGGHNRISLYKVRKEATLPRTINSRYGEDKKCVKIDTFGGMNTISWMNCSEFFETLCTFPNDTIHAEGTSLPWMNATQRCFELSGFATNNISSSEQLPKVVSWTGVIQSNVVYKYDELESWNFSITDIQCGYTYYTQEVMFTDQCNSEKKLFVKCRNESDVGVIIGSSIASLLVVIAVVAVIVVLKRRKKLPSLCKEAVPATTFGYQQSKRTLDEMTRDNHDYDHANIDNNNIGNISSESNYAHTYFVLEPHANESNTDNTTYDTSGNANKTETEQDNVYNKIELDSNETYDHAITKLRNGVPKVDDTYDTTKQAALKLKDTHGKDSVAFDETDEDAYNHITSKPVKNANTENDYNVTNTLENEYGDVVTHNKNNNHNEGDTYSHINNIS